MLASARASCTRSCIGIGGTLTRAGSSPSHPCSSRLDVSRSFAFPLRASRRNPTRSACSSADHADAVPSGNPATGSTLSHTHSTGTCPRICNATFRRSPSDSASHSIRFCRSSGSNTLPTSSSACVSVVRRSKLVHSTGPSTPPVLAYHRANSAAVLVFPLPA